MQGVLSGLGVKSHSRKTPTHPPRKCAASPAEARGYMLSRPDHGWLLTTGAEVVRNPGNRLKSFSSWFCRVYTTGFRPKMFVGIVGDWIIYLGRVYVRLVGQSPLGLIYLFLVTEREAGVGCCSDAAHGLSLSATVGHPTLGRSHHNGGQKPPAPFSKLLLFYLRVSNSEYRIRTNFSTRSANVTKPNSLSPNLTWELRLSLPTRLFCGLDCCSTIPLLPLEST